MYLFLQLEQGQPRVISSVELSNSDTVMLWFSPTQQLAHILPRERRGNRKGKSDKTCGLKLRQFER